MLRYKLSRAAELAEASYRGTAAPVIAGQHKDSLSEQDVEAHMLTDGTLLIAGSNSIMDYVRYNLRVQRLGRGRLRLTTVDGVSWHQGFLAHAKVVQDWLIEKNYPVSFIIGHSLGAASAQILSAGWNVPAIGFAAPRPCRTASVRAAADRCLLVNRSDDKVCTLPANFQHLGNVHICRPIAPNPGMDHSMSHYRAIISDPPPTVRLPPVWPQ